MEVNINKVVIKILQGSVLIQTVLGGLTTYILQLQLSYTLGDFIFRLNLSFKL